MNCFRILSLTIAFSMLACNKSNFSADDRAVRELGTKRGADSVASVGPDPICSGKISLSLLLDSSISMTGQGSIGDILGGEESMANIEKARKIAGEIVDSLSNSDEIGIASFAKQANQLVALQSISTGKSEAKRAATTFQAVSGLQNIGTNITGALRIADGMLSQANENKVIVIISDGEQQRVNEIAPEIYANNLKAENVKIFAIGLNLKPIGIESLRQTATSPEYFLNTDNTNTNIDDAIRLIKKGLCKN